MRFVVYLVAVLAAAGIVYYVSGVSPKEAPVAAAPSASESADTATPQGDDSVATTLVNLHVPSMHCPVACYPSVKKTLEGQSGVQAVDLAEQKEEGIIDNPVVVIKVKEGFDLDKAIQSLAQTGFDGASVVQ